MRQALETPVVVDNDANLAAFGEQWQGAGRKAPHFLCVTLGTGVGGGWVCNGELIHGFNGNAAEVGHITIDWNGPRCPCGNYGCLELYVSATAMVRRTRERLETEAPETALNARGLTTQAIFEAAEAGDAFARAMFEETGTLLGIGLVSLVSVTNVEVVALCGGLARAGGTAVCACQKDLSGTWYGRGQGKGADCGGHAGGRRGDSWRGKTGDRGMNREAQCLEQKNRQFRRCDFSRIDARVRSGNGYSYMGRTGGGGKSGFDGRGQCPGGPDPAGSDVTVAGVAGMGAVL